MASHDPNDVAAFRESGEPLPPLTERIAGAEEFTRLMHQLLQVHADRNGFVYTPTRSAGGDGGIDGHAPEGIPGMGGPVAFHWG